MWKFKSINPKYRAEKAKHIRDLGKPMVKIPMVGDPPMTGPDSALVWRKKGGWQQEFYPDSVRRQQVYNAMMRRGLDYV